MLATASAKMHKQVFLGTVFSWSTPSFICGNPTPFIVAHIGRAYASDDMGDAFERLKSTQNMLFDFSANTNDKIIGANNDKTITLNSLITNLFSSAAKFRRVIGVPKKYSDNFEFRPLVGLGEGFGTVDLLENAAIDLRRTSATYSTKVSRDIDQSLHPCMPHA